MKKSVLFLVALLVIGGIGWMTYQSQITTIGLVNFNDGQMAEIIKANDNSMIKPIQIMPKEDDFSGLVDYPVIYLSHVSVLSEVQRENLKKAMDGGSVVHVLMATSEENDFSNLSGEDLEYIKACFDNDGVSNTKRWLNYSRKVLDGKSLMTTVVTDPEKFAKDVFYRIGTDDYFESIEEYWTYYKKNKWYKEGRPVIVLMSANSSAQTQLRSYLDEMIIDLEKRDFNVVVLDGYAKRLENLKAINPDMVINFPHGRLARGDAAVDWIASQNILYLTPQLVYQTEEEWRNDQQGIAGGIMGQNVVVPELDGAIHPFAVAAQYETETGYHTFKPIPGRIEKFGQTAQEWLALKDKQNVDKKLVIYYYKGNGKNAMVAGGLETGSSLYQVLLRLKEEGYTVDGLPDTYEEFMTMVHSQGSVLGEYAKGTFEQFVKEGNPAFVTKEEYDQWVKKALTTNSYQKVLETYGEFPGKYLATTKEGQQQLAIPRVAFGNIAIMPVLPAALGENDFKMRHGVPVPPPHAYIASYLWSRHGFGADVIAHFGAHGSVEFTPWKQLVLSADDWAESLIAPTPHLYFYSIDNVGEAMMAKRRSYATMLSHLTPPYSNAELHGELQEMAELVHQYPELEDGALKTSYKTKIQAFIDSTNLDKDLDLTAEEKENLDPKTIENIHHYIHEIEQEKITMGLHTLGIPPTTDENNETVRMMAIDPISSALKTINVLQHGHDHSHDHSHTHDHGHHHDHSNGFQHKTPTKLADVATDDYEAQADFIIRKVLLDGVEPLTFFDEQKQTLLTALTEEYHAPEHNVISSYYGGNYGERTVKKKARKKTDVEMVYDPKTHKMVPKTSQKDSLTHDKAVGYWVHLAANRNTDKGLQHITSTEGYKEFIGLLDDKSFLQFKTAAAFNQSMEWKVDLFENKYFKDIVTFVKDSTQKEALFAAVAKEDVQGRIKGYRARMDEVYLNKALVPQTLKQFLNVYKTKASKWKDIVKTQSKDALLEMKANIQFYLKNKEALLINDTEESANFLALKGILKSDKALEKVGAQVLIIEKQIKALQTKEKQLFKALVAYKQALQDITFYRDNIAKSTQAELDGFINGMNGGFILPCSGGDPVSNPLAAPTGRNMYSVNEQVTPTREAFDAGQKMAKQILAKHIAKHGEYPKKIAYSLWGGEFIRNRGLNIGQIFYMLGVRPVRNTYGRVHDVELIPIDELKRPRIDVLVQTSGQFRDLAASRLYLIQKAVELAANADDDDQYKNFVKEGVVNAEKALKEKGFSPTEARQFATIRVFGGANGSYGTGIMGMVEKGDAWETEEEIAQTYINNMGAIYTKDNWSTHKEGVFETMMENAEVVVHPRSSNETGPISLDHVYEFMGGITASIRVTTGKDPDGYFNDNRNRHNPKVQGLKEAIWTETRTNLFNPKFIEAQMQEGESAAEGFAESFRDTYGWNVMKPDAIDAEVWEGYYDIYVKDKLDIGTTDFFEKTNPYALQEMTAVMLETIRKGYWQPSEAIVKDIAKTHAELVEKHKAGCSEFVCDNTKLSEMISGLLDGPLKDNYRQEVSEVRTASQEQTDEGMVLEKKTRDVEEFTQVIKDNLSTILLLIIMIGGAIVWGIVKRKQEV